MKSLCILALLAYPAVAVPSTKSADQLVHRIIDWGLKPAREKGLKQAVDAKEVARHSQDFSPTYFQLMLFVAGPQPEPDGSSRIQFGMDPLWMVQAAYIKEVTVGTPKDDGKYILVPVNYQSPNPIRPSQPGTNYSCVWVVGEEQGRAVVSDVRYHMKSPHFERTASIVSELQKVKAEYDARARKADP